MRKNLLFASIIFASLSPSVVRAQRKGIPMNSLSGYTVRDTNFSRKDFNVWLVTTEKYFDSLFVAQDSLAKKPNFEESLVVAVKAETPTNKYKTNYREMILRRNILRVYFTVTKDKPTKEDYGWVSLIAFPRNLSVRRVNFYHDEFLIKSVPVVIVY